MSDCLLSSIDGKTGYCPVCDPTARKTINLLAKRNCLGYPRPVVFQPRNRILPTPRKGPGTELKAFLHRFGINATENCNCGKRAIIMDERGEDWCTENLDTIVGWLKEEATKRHLPFSKTLGALVVKRAIRNSRKRKKRAQEQVALEEEEPDSSMSWAYGVTTVPSRMNDLLPCTLRSLCGAGFPIPRLFVDGEANPDDYAKFKLPITIRNPVLKIFGNFVLSLWELYLRTPNVDRYAIFQDDFVTYRNLRQYLDKCEYPEKGYWNLYTFPKNQALAPKGRTGWYLSNQLGKGAVAVVFSREAVTTLLAHDHIIARPQQMNLRSFKAVDGAIVTALKKDGWKEYVHNPSLVQHLGTESTLGNRKHALAKSFRGGEFDAMELLK